MCLGIFENFVDHIMIFNKGGIQNMEQSMNEINTLNRDLDFLRFDKAENITAQGMGIFMDRREVNNMKYKAIFLRRE